jgi:signal peptidase I
MRSLLAIVKTTGRLLGAAFLALALLALLVLSLGPRTGAYRTVTVLTGSMRPHMPEGSVVLATPAAVGSIRAGDVITYRIPVDDRRVVTHRVVEVVGPGVVRTKGDANNTPDPWLAKLSGAQVWKARGAVPKVGYGLERLRQPSTQRLLVLAVPLVLALTWLRDIWSREEREPLAPVVIASVPRTQGVVALAALLSLGAACARDRA